MDSDEYSESPNDIVVLGCAYTPLYGDEETTLFKHSDMTSDFAETVKGLPVFIEHDTSKQIGEVIDAYINEKRQLVTVLHLAGDPYANAILPQALYKDPNNDNRGYYNALSLGNDVGFIVEQHPSGLFSTKKVVNNRPSEVSIVRAGNRPMTEIMDYWIVPKNSSLSEYLNETVNPFIVRYH
jgi:hypothetical protein